MNDLDRPRLFLWEIDSYADELKLGYVDDKPFEPGIFRQGEPQSKWMQWTQYDRLGAMPEGVAPERFYLWSPLRSRNAVGDFSGASDRVVKIATKRFVDAIMSMGQSGVRVFPLTFWRRSESGTAPAPDPEESLRAVYCWAKVDVFDMEKSNVPRLDPWRLTKFTSNPYDDGNPEPPIYSRTFMRLTLREGINPGRIELPPLFGIRGLEKRLFVSPDLAQLLREKKFRVNLIERMIDYEREAQIGDAVRAGRLSDWPQRRPLGA